MTTTIQSEPPGQPVSPLDAFRGSFARSEPSLLYKAGLAVVAFAMVLLPAIYIGLVGFAAWGVVYHLRHNIGILTSGSGGSLGRAMIYFGPAVAGAILVFFMVKPFFAREAKRPEPLTLDRASEPLLFAFVEKICRLVGAPAPSCIQVDCQVNASASLRRGLLSKDLALTIGLPLAAGLDMRQFAGVLAHEFGHFAQGAGMRMTHVIRKISFWFARVVYERDAFDMQLEQAAKNADLRIGIILHAARGCVWLTRRVLWALMNIGNAISCFMLRQMEYDADSYEAKLAGSDAFEQTAARLQTLNAGAQFAYGDLRQSWASSRLPENLPLLINHRSATLPAEVHQKMAESAATVRTGWFDTHPCDADRVRAARALNQPGVFALTESATRLFANFEELSKAATVQQYQKQFELEFTDQNLVSTEEMLRESSASAEAEALVRKYYGEVNISLKPLAIEPDPFTGRVGSLADWEEARRSCANLRAAAEKSSAAFGELQRRLVDARTAFRLAKAGFQLKAKEFGLPASATSAGEQETAARAAIEEASASASDRLLEVEPFIAAVRRRVNSAIRFALQTPEFRGAEKAQDLLEFARLLAAVAAEMPAVHDIATKLPGFASLAQNRGNHSDPAAVDKAIAEIANELKTAVEEIQSRLANYEYPFAHARGRLTVAEYARTEQKTEHELQRVYVGASDLVDKLFALHYRLVGRILSAADAAERSLEPPSVR